MDALGNIGPEKGNYAADVRHAALDLRQHCALYLTLCDRGSQLGVALLVRPPTRPLPEGVEEGHVFVAVNGRGAYWLRIDGYLAPEYVADKLRLAYGDGETVAEFLTRLGLAMKIKELA